MKKIILPVIICLIVLMASIAVLQFSAQHADERMMDSIETSTSDNNAPTTVDANVDATTTDTMPTDDTASPSMSLSTDVAPQVHMKKTTTQTEETITMQQASAATTTDGALVLGAKNAPVTITEYSSLSCGHCAAFHKETLPLLKKDYIDTGMVKFVFRDFPLNQEAMDGSKLLRCINPNDRYDFMNLLFEQQAQWAHGTPDYQDKLKQYAALLGVSNDMANECMNDKGVENAIILEIQNANNAYKVDSTPTFVFSPGDKVMPGAMPYASFSTVIEELAGKATDK